jgi:hypothetical protein
MDVDKLQKINKLAMELKNHGMADDMTQAVSQAEQMIRNDGELTSVTSMSDSGVIKIERDSPETSTTSAVNIPGKAPEHELHVRSLQNQMKRQEETIVEMQQKMNEMIEMMNQLEQKQKSMKVFASDSPVTTDNPEHPKVERQSQFKEPVPPKPSPRCGSYNSEDVEIEKFFYYGNK